MDDIHVDADALRLQMIAAFFSRASLRSDRFLRAFVLAHRWIPISVFQSPVRLGVLADDHVVVAKAVRASLSGILDVSSSRKVSDDGRSLRMRSTDLADAATPNMFYVENIPPFATVSTLVKRIENISSVHLPLTSIIHQYATSARCHKISRKSKVFPPKLLTLVDFTIPADRSVEPDMDIRLPGFAFVVIQSRTALDPKFGSRWRPFRLSDSRAIIPFIACETKRIGELEDDEVDDWEYARVMSINIWEARMDQYYSLANSKRNQLESAMDLRHGSHSGASYEAGVVVRYSNVHRGTSRKILKTLFELVAPVSFVDYTKGETEGFVRFKTPMGATLATSYFSHQNIVQINSKDVGTLITSVKHLQRLKSSIASERVEFDEWDEVELEYHENLEESINLESDVVIGIRLIVLQGDEEEAYWNEIYQKQQNTSAFSNPQPWKKGLLKEKGRTEQISRDTPNVHIKFAPDGEESDVREEAFPLIKVNIGTRAVTSPVKAFDDEGVRSEVLENAVLPPKKRKLDSREALEASTSDNPDKEDVNVEGDISKKKKRGKRRGRGGRGQKGNKQMSSPNGDTPPMIMNPAINTAENQRSIALVIGLFVSIFPLFYLFQVVINRWFLGEQKWTNSMAEAATAAQTITSNFKLILHHLVAVPTKKEVVSSAGKCLIPFGFLLSLIVSIIVLQNAIAVHSVLVEQYTINVTQVQAGLIAFFVSCNGFLVSRILEYYKEKTEVRKKAAAYAFKISNNNYSRQTNESGVCDTNVAADAVAAVSIDDICTFDSSSQSISSKVEAIGFSDNPIPKENSDSEVEHQAPIFDSKFEYIRRVKHLLPQYNYIHLSFGNFMQLFVLITEFIQLASFPFRDLLMYSNFQQSLSFDSDGFTDTVGYKFIETIRSITSTISSGLPTIDTLVLSNIRFAIAWWISLLGIVLAALVMTIKAFLHCDFLSAHPRLKKFCKSAAEGSWVVYFQPLTSILYLIVISPYIFLIFVQPIHKILGSFVEPLGCFSSSDQPLWPPELGGSVLESVMNKQIAIKLRQEQCAPILLNPPLQVWCSVVGYIMAYYLLTIFKVCDEQKPREGIVTFTSRSEVLNKNGSLTLLLLYTLIPTSDSTTLRGIVAAIVLCFMIFYQIRIGSSYIRPVNFWRSISFTWVLWMSLCIVYFTHPNQASFYNITQSSTYRPWIRIFLTIVFGWLCVLVVYAVLHFSVLRAIERQSTKPRTGITYTYGSGDDEDSQVAIIASKFASAISSIAQRIRGTQANVGINQTTIGRPEISQASAIPIVLTTDPIATLRSVRSATSDSTSVASASSAAKFSDRSSVYNSVVRPKLVGPRGPLSADSTTAGFVRPSSLISANKIHYKLDQRSLEQLSERVIEEGRVGEKSKGGGNEETLD
ncbi:hypothetical protein HDU82_003838 [Entophlyctis luteolus]|nr:hypothetical protein HDU82_003838 [Entophlyctis luteolus]